jgi:hypothetical protein
LATSHGVNTSGRQSAKSGRNLFLFGGTKPVCGDWYSPVLARTTRLAGILILAVNRGCVSMIAPPLSPTVGFHSVSACCRPGGRQMLSLLLRQLLIF